MSATTATKSPCHGCGGIVPKGRHKWCSDVCRAGGVPRREVADVEDAARTLRAAKRVNIELSDRCVERAIEGRVSAVWVTGTVAIVAGWHVPLEDIRAVTILKRRPI